MATIKINNVTALTESGGTVVLDSAVTGIPAAGVTGVLPVAVTGGSGLTALGTVTAGDISHADIVYPAGHVLQTATIMGSGTAQTKAADGSWADLAFGGGTIEVTMTTKKANSKFFLMTQTTVVVANSERIAIRWNVGASTDVGNTLTYMVLGGTGTAYLPLTAIHEFPSSIAKDVSTIITSRVYCDNGPIDILAIGTTMVVMEIAT
jgi:hypothetical protein